MKLPIKRKLKNQYFIQKILSLYHQFSARKYKNLSTQAIFEDIFEKNHWKSQESRSGSGSEFEQTQVIRDVLPRLIEKYQIKTLLDVPCGDFNWMKAVDLSQVQYIGGDIVEKIILQNQKHYSNSQRKFFVLDIVKDTLPNADLLLVRDAWVHLPNELVSQSIQNLKKSSITYLLTTHFTKEKRNTNIITGSWRAINLQTKPFYFPPPIEIIYENSTESGGQYQDKSLSLWKLSDLK